MDLKDSRLLPLGFSINSYESMDTHVVKHARGEKIRGRAVLMSLGARMTRKARQVKVVVGFVGRAQVFTNTYTFICRYLFAAHLETDP